MLKKISIILCALTTSALASNVPLLGTWLTEEQKATVEITPCDHDKNTFCGKIIALKEPFEEDGLREG